MVGDVLLGVVGDGVVGLLPVALAVPEGSGLVVVPEGVVLSPNSVIEQDVLLTLIDGSRGEPHDVREQLSFLVG